MTKEIKELSIVLRNLSPESEKFQPLGLREFGSEIPSNALTWTRKDNCRIEPADQT